MKEPLLFSVKEIAILKKVTEKTVLNKANEFGITPVARKKGTSGYLFAEYQVKKMFDKITKKQFVAFNPEIIYVTRTIEIYPSKLNFM
jgi:hypothetical protein